MKKMLFILTVFLTYSCHHQNAEQDIAFGKTHIPDDALYLDEEIEIEPPRTAEPPAPDGLEKGSKIIRKGEMRFDVSKLENAKARVDTLVKSVNGYYENESYKTAPSHLAYSLRIRMPNERFDSLIHVLQRGLGVMQWKRVSTNDVTEEYIDLTLRLQNKMAYLKQYQTILQKASTVKDMLEVKKEIRQIEEEIESKKGRLKYLEDNVQYSTLQLELFESVPVKSADRPGFFKRVSRAFYNGIQGFLNFVVAVVNFWPFLFLFVVLYLGWKPLLSKIKRRWRSDRG